MSLAHIFTGLGPDFGNIKRSFANQAMQTKQQKDALKKRFPPAEDPVKSACSSPTAACVQNLKLQEAEDDRWMEVEGGSPRRWRSCPDCAFLNAASTPLCEVCGLPALALSLVVDESGAGGAGLPATSGEDDQSRRPSLREVVIADSIPALDDIQEVSRQTLVLAVFKALDRRGRDRLGPEALRRFTELAGFPEVEDWSIEYVELAEECGWDAMQGAHLRHFSRCVDDISGKWYCPTSTLWLLLSRLDKQAGLAGAGSYTAAAYRLEDRGLEINLSSTAADAPATLQSKQRTHEIKENNGRIEDDDAEDSARDDSEVVGDDSEDEDDQENQEGVCIAGALDVSPPEGTAVAVLYDDDVWYTARITEARGTKAVILYDEEGDCEELDFDVHAVRLADYVSDNEGDDIEDDDESSSKTEAPELDDESESEADQMDESSSQGDGSGGDCESDEGEGESDVESGSCQAEETDSDHKAEEPYEGKGEESQPSMPASTRTPSGMVPLPPRLPHHNYSFGI